MGQFRTNRAIACDTLAYMLRTCRAREIASEIPEIFYTFGPLLNTFMTVGILLKVFLSGTVNNAVNRFSVFVMYEQK